MMQELSFITKFLKGNRKYVLDRFRNKGDLTITSKADPNDLLTEVDLTIQKRFVEAVAKRYPADLVIGEESGLAVLPRDTPGRAWLIDPIDGTYNFVRGLNPAFGVSIGFVQGGVAQAAGVALPLSGHLFTATLGGGAFCDGRRLVVSSVQQIAESCLEIDFSAMDDRRPMLRRASDVLRSAGQIRCQGSAVLGICQVATGDVEGYLHMGLYPWDYAAAQLIAEEAGAVATRLTGEPLRVFDGKSGVLITNGAIHKAVLAMLNR